jgi:preprotein translocase subunit SecG
MTARSQGGKVTTMSAIIIIIIIIICKEKADGEQKSASGESNLFSNSWRLTATLHLH